jgi:hypothetical protein
MSMTRCNGCGNVISPKAFACPKCGHPNERAHILLSGGQILMAVVIAGGMFWYFEEAGLEGQNANNMQRIEVQAVADAVTQYEAARQQGDVRQACAQARLVSEAYQQADDEAHYQKWKDIEASDCRFVDFPR